MASWYVRKGGSDTNGGSSSSLTPDRTGTDGVTGNNSTTFTSASAAFTAGDVGKGIYINTKGRYRITAFTNSTTVTIDRAVVAAASGLTWNIGGAVQSITTLLSNGLSTTAMFGSTIVGGETIYIGSGTYRAVLTTTGTTALTSTVTFLGDVSGKNTGDAPGPVVVSAYLTDDKTAPSASTALTLSASRPFLTFQNIVFHGGTASPSIANIGDTNDVTFTDCAFISPMQSNVSMLGMTATTATAKNILFDRCYFLGRSIFSLTFPTKATPDYDVNFVIRNCMIVSLSGVIVDITASGALSNKPGGVIVRNSTIIAGGSPLIRTNTANMSTTIPCQVVNSLLVGTGTALTATTAGQITEDYNLLVGSTPRTNVTAGTHSISDGSYMPNIHFGQERIWGATTRPFGEPVSGSPVLGFGNDGTGMSVDVRNAPRPAGGASANKATGAYERANTFVKETSTVHSGSSGLVCTGPGYQDFLIPVDAVSTTLSIYARYDSTYAGTRPQIQLLANDEIGVAAQTITASTSALNAWEQQSTAAFTPSAKGIVTLRLISNDTNGGGKAFFDSFSVA